MCGFAGYILNDNIWENSHEIKKDLSKMSKSIYHRGPDANGLLVDKENKLGIAFQRLSIIDLSDDAKQPMLSNCKQWIIVFNGEIYNYKELKNRLLDYNINWKTTSDTEVILECFAKYGFSKTIAMLDGMFGIAAYSFKEKSLWLARDKFGEKPLYYCLDDKNNFFFCSDLKALMSSKFFRKKLNREVSSDFIRFGYVPDPMCILDKTKKLNAGNILKFDSFKKIRLGEYWNTLSEFIKMKNKPFKGSYNKAIEEVKFRIKNATRSRIISDVPLGAFLSGGVDSSNLVLSLINQEVNLKTFSIGFEDKTKNESHFAKEIATVLNTKHHEKILNDEDCVSIIPDIIKYYDEPFSDPSQIPTFLLSKFAKKNIKVAISGDGADELFGGYPRYKNISLFWNNIDKVPKLLIKAIENIPYVLSSSKFKALKSFGKKFRKISHLNIESLYNDELSRWRPDERMYNKTNKNENNFYKYLEFDRGKISNYRYLMLRDFLTYLPSNLLVKIDRASMANSLEVRNPYLDPDLVKLAWSLPDKYINNNNIEKSILREILGQKFPDNLSYRQKQGFEPPLDSWLKGPLKDWAYSEICKKDDIIDAKKLKSLFQDFLNGEKKLTYKIWPLIMFKAWRSQNAI